MFNLYKKHVSSTKNDFSAHQETRFVHQKSKHVFISQPENVLCWSAKTRFPLLTRKRVSSIRAHVSPTKTRFRPLKTCFASEKTCLVNPKHEFRPSKTCFVRQKTRSVNQNTIFVHQKTCCFQYKTCFVKRQKKKRFFHQTCISLDRKRVWNTKTRFLSVKNDVRPPRNAFGPPKPDFRLYHKTCCFHLKNAFRLKKTCFLHQRCVSLARKRVWTTKTRLASAKNVFYSPRNTFGPPKT